MKKTCLFLIAAVSVWCSARTSPAAISVTATPSTTMNVVPGGSFTVSLTLSVTQTTAPANVVGFDLRIGTSSASAGLFQVTATNPTGSFNGFGPTLPNGGDPLSTAGVGSFRYNSVDLGYSASTPQATPLTNTALESVTLTLASTVPTGTYTFQTTTTATAGNDYSDVGDSGGNVYEITAPGTFSINVVPEPSAWVMLLVAAGVVFWRSSVGVAHRGLKR